MSWYRARYLTRVPDVTPASTEGFAGYDVVLLLGQSNMVGTARAETTSALLDYASPRIEQWGQNASAGTDERPCLAQDPLQHADGSGVGGSLAMSFARCYEGGLGAGRKLLLVPCAWGGTGFSGPGGTGTSVGGVVVTLDWLAGTPGNLLDLAVRRANRAMAYHPVLNPSPAYSGSTPPARSPYNSLRAVLWHQGETDASAGVSEAQYRAYLRALVTDVRARVSGASDSTPFVVGLPTPAFVAANPTAGPIAVLPRVGNLAYFARPNCGFADSLTPTPLATNAENDIHFSSQGSREYGARYYEAYLRLAAPPAVLTDVRANVGPTFFDPIRVSWGGRPHATFLETYTSDGTLAWSAATTGNAYLFPGGGANLQPLTDYRIALVPATEAGVRGAVSNVAVTTAAATPPAAVSDLSLVPGAEASVLATWKTVRATHAVVAVGAGDPPVSYADVGNTSTGALTIAGLQPLAPHTVRVTPYFGAAPGTAATRTVTTGALSVPSLSNVAAVPVPDSNVVVASWTSANATTVSVSYGLGASPGSYTLYADSATSPLALTGALGAGAAYAIRVVPYNRGLPGEPVTVQVTTSTPPPGLTMRLKPASAALPAFDSLGNPLEPIDAPAVATDGARGHVLDTRGGHLVTTVELAASYTKSAWVYALSTGGIGYNIIGSVTGAPQHYFFVDTGVLKNGHFPFDDIHKWVADPDPLPLETWTHVAVTYDDATNGMILYRDGVAVATFLSAEMAWGGGGPLSLGHLQAYYNPGDPAALRWDGYLDDLRTYDYAVSPTNIGDLSAGVSRIFDRAPVLQLSPLLYLDADRAAGGAWTDLSGNGYDFAFDPACATLLGQVPVLDFTGQFKAPRFQAAVPLSNSITVVTFSTLTERREGMATTLIAEGGSVYQVMTNNNNFAMWTGSEFAICTDYDLTDLPDYSTAINMLAFRLCNDPAKPYEFLAPQGGAVTSLGSITDAAIYDPMGGINVVGNHADVDDQGWGKIAALMVFDYRLTDQQLQDLYDGCRLKYGAQ